MRMEFCHPTGENLNANVACAPREAPQDRGEDIKSQPVMSPNVNGEGRRRGDAYCRGRPRPRWAMMLRCISDVPAAIVMPSVPR